MKFKHLLSASLMAFLFSSVTIFVIGMWIVPQKDLASNIAQGGNQGANGTSPVATNNSEQSPIQDEQSTTDNGVTTTPLPTPAQAPANPTPITTPKTTNKSTSSSAPSSSTSPPSTTTPSPTPTPTPTPTPKPTPPPPVSAPACGTSGGVCTAAQIATHNTQSNCWMSYSGGYYILTSYVSKHPPGAKYFNDQSCGKDATGFMNGSQSAGVKSHSHSSSAYSILKSYYVGPAK